MRNYAQRAIVDKNAFLLIRLFLRAAAAKLILVTWHAAYFLTVGGFCKCSKTCVYNSEEENEALK